MCKYLVLLLQSCLVLLVSASVIKRYQEFPLQMCPANAVCSEIYSVSSQRLLSTFFTHVTCKCPTSTYCPEKPGAQTFMADKDLWYGLCQPVSDIPRCSPGQTAVQLVEEASDLVGQAFTKILCRCDGELLEENSGAMWSDVTSDSASATYNLICKDDSMVSKRARFGGNNRSRGRFYFYKK